MEGAKKPRTKQTPEEQSEYEKARRQTPERKKYLRQYERNRTAVAKETGKCKDCPNPSEPMKVRCRKCRDKHRLDGANRIGRLKEERETQPTS